jgi:hypothetical protein
MRHAREDYERFQDPLDLIPEDEPVFLIRGQDLTAPDTLQFYADLAAKFGASEELVQRVRDHADAMQCWQKARAMKVPDLLAQQPSGTSTGNGDG